MVGAVACGQQKESTVAGPLQEAVYAEPTWPVCDPQQGLVKSEGKARYGEQYRMWQQRAAEFEIDGRAPVRCDPAVQCGACNGRCMSVPGDGLSPVAVKNNGPAAAS